MKKKLTTPMLASIGALALVCALFLSFYLSTGAYRSGGTGILLPSQVRKNEVSSALDSAQQSQICQEIAVTPDNAQDIIATLNRPDAYTMTLVSTIYAGEKSRAEYFRQTVMQDMCRTDTLNHGEKVMRTVLRKGAQMYAWEAGNSSYYTGKSGDFSDDSAAMLPTYEDVLSLPKQQIEQAELTNIGYEPCVKLTFVEDEFRTIYAVSTISGLLYQAEFYQEDVLFQKCNMTAYSQEEPAESVFLLPDGTAIK